MLLGTVIGAVLSGCTGAGFGTPPTETASNGALAPPLVPAWAQPAGTKRLRLGERIVREASSRGIYASDLYGAGSYGQGFVAGYSGANKRNKPAACTIIAPSAGSIDVDPAGDLVVPGEFGVSYQPEVNVYQGPGLCGPLIGSLVITTGNRPVAARSLHPRTGKIVVAEDSVYGSGGPGGLVVCTIAAGCGEPLRRPNVQGGALGVALAKNGDCWMSAEEYEYYNPPGSATLAYFKHCQGSGKTATGYQNPYFGSLFFDRQGNLGAISAIDGALYVYKGCNPACTLVGGPFALQGISTGAGLNKGGNELAVGDLGNEAVDIYAYTPTSLTYLYSINNGLNFTESSLSGAAFSPASEQ
jgi:hypothetical protein